MPQIHEHSLVGHSYNERLPALIFGLSLLGPKSSPSPYHTQHLIPVVPFTRNDIITISLTDYTLNHSAISPSLKTTQQCPLLAPLVHSPKTVWECVRACVCGRNELEVCTTLAYPHISSFRTMPVLYTSTRTLKPFQDSEPTGAKGGYSQLHNNTLLFLQATTV